MSVLCSSTRRQASFLTCINAWNSTTHKRHRGAAGFHNTPGHWHVFRMKLGRWHDITNMASFHQPHLYLGLIFYSNGPFIAGATSRERSAEPWDEPKPSGTNASLEAHLKSSVIWRYSPWSSSTISTRPSFFLASMLACTGQGKPHWPSGLAPDVPFPRWEGGEGRGGQDAATTNGNLVVGSASLIS